MKNPAALRAGLVGFPLQLVKHVTETLFERKTKHDLGIYYEAPLTIFHFPTTCKRSVGIVTYLLDYCQDSHSGDMAGEPKIVSLYMLV